MPGRGNPYNLINNALFTPEERSERARVAGRASAIARKQQGFVKKAAKLCLKMKIKDDLDADTIKILKDNNFDINDKLTVLTAGLSNLAAKAIKGDKTALDMLISYSGEKIEQMQKDEEIDIKRDTYLLSVDQNNQTPKDRNIHLKYVVDEVTA